MRWPDWTTQMCRLHCVRTGGPTHTLLTQFSKGFLGRKSPAGRSPERKQLHSAYKEIRAAFFGQVAEVAMQPHGILLIADLDTPPTFPVTADIAAGESRRRSVEACQEATGA